MGYTELQESKKSQFGQPSLLQRAAITLVSAACNLFFPAVPDPLLLVIYIPIHLVIGKVCMCRNVLTLVSA